jgi:hypothetical protein
MKSPHFGVFLQRILVIIRGAGKIGRIFWILSCISPCLHSNILDPELHFTMPCSLLLTPYSLLIAPYSLLLTPCSLLLAPYSLLLTPCSLLLAPYSCPGFKSRLSPNFFLSYVPHFVPHMGYLGYLYQKYPTLGYMECDPISSYLILLSFNFIMLN